MKVISETRFAHYVCITSKPTWNHQRLRQSIGKLWYLEVQKFAFFIKNRTQKYNKVYICMLYIARKVWRYQRDNTNPSIEGQTIHLPREQGQNIKQWSMNPT